MNAKLTVLFVDDDPYWSQNYQAELRKQFSVVYKSSADGAIAELAAEGNIDLLVLDVMMDTPDSVEVTETEGGLMTGVWILEKQKPSLVKKRTPVIILTNRQKNLVVEAVNSLSYPDRQVTVFSKTEMSARQLPSEVQLRLGK